MSEKERDLKARENEGGGLNMRVKFQTQDIKSGEIYEEETTVSSKDYAGFAAELEAIGDREIYIYIGGNPRRLVKIIGTNNAKRKQKQPNR